ncbi:hypothetical protein ACIBF1_09280 [Spirillospora sp. NPDC050679]
MRTSPTVTADDHDHYRGSLPRDDRRPIEPGRASFQVGGRVGENDGVEAS